MLLTRSRLCPRPKPGSSLHLHVLGTPPAFVLSQDQTLREELQYFTKSRQRYNPPCQNATKSRPSAANHSNAAAGQNPGSAPGGIRPLRPHRGSPWYTLDSGTQDGVNLGTAVRTNPKLESIERRRRTWTHISTEGSVEVVRMLLSFQRPSHLFERASFSGVRPGSRSGFPERTGKYSARRAPLGRPPQEDHETHRKLFPDWGPC